MWGFIAKAVGWAIAHKTEIGAGISIWRRLRRKRVDSGESAKDFYVGNPDVLVREATQIVHDSARISDRWTNEAPPEAGSPE